MPSEQDLRDLFASGDGPRNTIDAKRVIARSRGRRRPLQIVAGAASALAVAGIVTVAVQTAQLPSPATMSSQGESSSAPMADSPRDTLETTLSRAPAEKLNLCQGTLAQAAPSTYGLRLDVAFPAVAPSGTAPVTGAVRLTNTGSTRVTGYTNPTPAITLSRDGVVLWHSNGPMIMSLAIVDLEPGASMEYAASFTPVRCDVEDDLGASFREGLPALPAGQYDLSAAIDFTPDASAMPSPSATPSPTAELDLVTGPLAPISLG